MALGVLGSLFHPSWVRLSGFPALLSFFLITDVVLASTLNSPYPDIFPQQFDETFLACYFRETSGALSGVE